MAKKQLQKALGLMSGTSADGSDVALVATDGENAIEFFGGLTLPYDRELRAWILEPSQHDVPLTELARIERDIEIAARLLPDSGLRLSCSACCECRTHHTN